ncbi:MFS transporter [Ferruginibacter albus]|uniref:MFS transporter n=1 Tax=Ferruginibacter albus TaxID=2875540 RepID=UPI001CC6633F|nr:MFS transporter [Ferruginibacter albus]UAY52484.1 MFS transporter [Ferruginibacter albus]
MPKPTYTKPFYFLFLVLPTGISSGFVTVTLPYLLTHRGFSVTAATIIAAAGVSANIWRFVWGPLADLTLTLRKWYGIAVLATIITLLALCFIHFNPKDTILLTVLVFVSQVAGTFVMLPVGGFMANRIEAHHKGRASGWFQAGNVGGTGLGGGVGLWLASHYNITIAAIGLCVMCILSGLVVLLIQDVASDKEKSFEGELGLMGKDLLEMIKIPIVLFVIILILLPIGSGAANNVWSAIADDWKASADRVALVTGIVGGIVGGVGSIAGGFIADRFGNWVAYLGIGVLCALVTVIMALLPYHPDVYTGGVLAYNFTTGMAYAAFSSMLLYAIGKKNASTKYSLLSSFGNLPVMYMTAFDGWIHDKHSSKYMLVAEAVVGILFVLISAVVLKRMMMKKLVPEIVE